MTHITITFVQKFALLSEICIIFCKHEYFGEKKLSAFCSSDDEAFGPGGTIAKLSDSQDVYIICATRGEAGGTQENLGR